MVQFGLYRKEQGPDPLDPSARCAPVKFALKLGFNIKALKKL